MAKYHIISYKKIEQSFLAGINSMVGVNEKIRGVQEPYDITLTKSILDGWIKWEVTKRVYLPKGFDAETELVKDREFKFNSNT